MKGQDDTPFTAAGGRWYNLYDTPLLKKSIEVQTNMAKYFTLQKRAFSRNSLADVKEDMNIKQRGNNQINTSTRHLSCPCSCSYLFKHPGV